MTVRVLVGDALSVLRTLPAESVQLVCTSPPYFGLRSYSTEPQVWGGDPGHGHAWGVALPAIHPGQVPHGATITGRGHADAIAAGQTASTGAFCPCGAWRGELGSEPTPGVFIEHLVSIFDEVWRVLRPDGLVFCNLGDSYSGSGKGPTGQNGLQNAETRQGFEAGYLRANGEMSRGGRKSKTEGVGGIPAKNLLLVPQRFAIAMQEPRHVGPIKREVDRAWLAALIDADGCLSARKFHPAEYKEKGWNAGYIPFLAVSQSDTQALEHCVKITGLGSVITKWTPDEEHPDPRGIGSRHGRKPMFTWRLDGAQIGAVLRDIYPYLLIKKQQAKVLYALVESVGERRPSRSLPVSAKNIEWRRQLFECVKRLNQRESVDLPPLCDPPPAIAPGWIVRSEIVWAKTSAMPESVRDRPTSAWEPIWMFSKSQRYFYDGEAVRQPVVKSWDERDGPVGRNGLAVAAGGQRNPYTGAGLDGANLRNVWTLGPSPFADAHFATFPPEIPRRCILAGSRPGDTVLDPFGGSGTTGLVADRLGRDAILIELNPAYARMAEERIRSDAGLLFGETVTVEQPEQLDLFDGAAG